MLTRNRVLGASVALALLAIVGVLAVTGGREAVAQPPTASDRFDEILDELIRIRSEVADLRAELTLTRGELSDVRAELAVVNARLQRLARTTRVAERDPAEYTKAFVRAAIDRYEVTGREATLAYYNSPESVDGQWYMFILDEDDVIVANRQPGLIGMDGGDVDGPDGYPVGRMVLAAASEEGSWVDYQFTNLATGEVQVKHSWVIRHDGLIFGSGWYEDGPSPVDDQPGYTQAFVERAVHLYDALGREAVVEYYNTAGSVDGQWYLVVVDDTDETLLANAARPDLLGSDVSDVHGPDGYPVARVVNAAATEAGQWVEYIFNNPESGRDEIKHVWVIRHDGLRMLSGWYERAPSPVQEPGAYTQGYVRRAIQLYDVLGREAAFEFYNMSESADGQWHMFIHQTDGTRVAHGVRAGWEGWLGSNNSSAVDVTGYAYAADILAIEDRGWVSYVFANPVDEGRYQRKHSWVVVHDGLQFGSGWYDRNYDLQSEDPAGYARVLVQEAIDRYESEGREATLAYHNSAESVDGQWYVFIYDEEGYRIAHPVRPELVGQRLDADVVDATGRSYAAEILAVTDAAWVSYVFLNPATGENHRKHTWLVRHDGLLFAAGYYDAEPYVAPDSGSGS